MEKDSADISPIRQDKGQITVSNHTPDGKKRVWWECSPLQFLPIVSRLKEAQARLITIQATPDEEKDIRLSYYFTIEGTTLIVKTHTDKSCINSLYTLFTNSDFIEREINNIFKIKFLGHPNLPRYGSAEE
jgi:NADH:ubiquinone oxidoreductase subunit C